MNTPKPITDILRKAVNDSGMTFLGMERETGVLRQCLMPFARGESGISLDAADKLANYFGLELRPASKPKTKGK
jgi:plasmid maintenance system antidote protein VapI